MEKIRPLNDYLLVERMAEEDKTPGGLFIPDAAREKPLEGRVLAVGKGKMQDSGVLRPVGINAGERVLFTKYAGTELSVGGQTLLMLREEDVLAVVES